MDYDKLVEYIYNEVNKKINLMENLNSNKKTAIVMWDDDKSNYSSINHIFNINSFEDRKQEFDILIVSKLCLRGLSTLALGTNVSEEERFVLISILRGKKVYVLENGMEYIRYKDTAPKPLYNKYLEYVRQIKTFGVKIISNISDILNDFQTDNNKYLIKNVAQIDVSQKEIDRFLEKKLITEADVNKLYLQGIMNITVAKSSILTPLANDYIKSHKMIVKRI